jgi:hypothetical protein
MHLKILTAISLGLAVSTFGQSPPPQIAAGAKHPFTFEDMMKLKRVAEPVPSPDGKWVVFAVQDIDLNENTKKWHLWIVPQAVVKRGD